MGAPYDDLMLADPSQPQGPTDGSGLTADQRGALAAAVVGAPSPMDATLQSLLSPLYPEPPPVGLSPEDHANITALLGGPRPAQSLSDAPQSVPGPIQAPGAADPASLDPMNGLTNGRGLSPQHQAALDAMFGAGPPLDPTASDPFQSLSTPLYPSPPPVGLSPEDHANITALLFGGQRAVQGWDSQAPTPDVPASPPGLPFGVADAMFVSGSGGDPGPGVKLASAPLSPGSAPVTQLAAHPSGSGGLWGSTPSPHAANVLQHLAGQASNPFIRFDPSTGRLEKWSAAFPGGSPPGASGSFKPMSDEDTQGFIERQLGANSYQQGQKSPQENALEAQLDPGNPLSPQALREFYALKQMLSDPNEEDHKRHVYYDTTQHLTVGIGHKVLPSDHLKFGDLISVPQLDQFFSIDGSAALAAAHKQAAEAGISDPAFILPLASVNFQAGSGWRHNHIPTWQYIMAGRYADAAASLDGTKWQRETPSRVRDFQTALRLLQPRAQN